MKSTAVALEAIGRWEALHNAWRSYRSGKRRRPDVASFELDAETLLLHLSREIMGGCYRHGCYDLLRIHDPKPRLIAVAPVRDRIVHTSVYKALAPSFESSLIQDTYACLKGRGAHRALFRYLEFLRHHRYLVHLDIRCYYPSVSHDLLLSVLEPRIRNLGVRRLVEVILRSGWELYRRPTARAFFGLPEIRPDTRPHGLPIGNLTSQWWGNQFLNGLDHFIKRTLKVKAYLRYMDDMVCFADEASVLRTWKREIRDWLHEERALSLHSGKGQIRPTKLPQDYLGYRVTREGYDLGMKVRKRIRKALPSLVREGPERLEKSLVAWRGALLL